MRPVTLLPCALALLVCAGAAAGSPEIDYMLHCQGCHRADGGETPGSVPALDGMVARFLTVPGGRAFLVQVPGSAQSALADRELAALLNWIVARFGPAADAADAPPYTEAEVARLRAVPLVEVDAVRADLVAAMEAEPAP